MVEIINLRGPHLEDLAEAYARESGFFRVEKGKSPYQIKHEEMLNNYRESHGEEAYQKFIELSSRPPVLRDDFYKVRKNKDQVLGALQKDWLSNSDLNVRVVAGPDSLCGACPIRVGCYCTHESLSEEDIEYDSVPLSVYGLEHGGVYTMGDLITKFKEYYDKTQFPSQRTKNGFGRNQWDKIVRTPITK